MEWDRETTSSSSSSSRQPCTVRRPSLSGSSVRQSFAWLRAQTPRQKSLARATGRAPDRQTGSDNPRSARGRGGAAVRRARVGRADNSTESRNCVLDSRGGRGDRRTPETTALDAVPLCLFWLASGGVDRRTLEIIALDAGVEEWRIDVRWRKQHRMLCLLLHHSAPHRRVEGILTDSGDNHTGSLLSILMGEGGECGRSEKTAPDAVSSSYILVAASNCHVEQPKGSRWPTNPPADRPTARPTDRPNALRQLATEADLQQRERRLLSCRFSKVAWLSGCPDVSVCLPVRLCDSVFLSVGLGAWHFAFMFGWQFLCLAVYLASYTSCCLFGCCSTPLSVCLSVRPCLCLSIGKYVCLSVCIRHRQPDNQPDRAS